MAGARACTLHVETTRENLPAVMTLVAEVLREPAFDAKELEQLRTEMLAGIEQQRSDPGAIASTAFQQRAQAISQGRHPLRGLDRRRHRQRQGGHARAGAAQFHRDFFGAQPAQVAAVGDFDAAAVREAGGASCSAAGRRRSRSRAVPTTTSTCRRRPRLFETPDKAQAIYHRRPQPEDQRRRSGLSGTDVRQLHAGRRIPELAAADPHPRQGRPELRRGLAAAAPRRQDKSGSFNVLCHLRAAEPREARAGVQGGNAARAHRGVHRRGNHAGQVRLAAGAQRGALRRTAGSRPSCSTTCSSAARFAWDAEFEKKVQALDAAQIRAAMVKYIDPRNSSS